jgi:hypothetical protein
MEQIGTRSATALKSIDYKRIFEAISLTELIIAQEDSKFG